MSRVGDTDVDAPLEFDCDVDDLIIYVYDY
jgi:hypothetical protein